MPSRLRFALKLGLTLAILWACFSYVDWAELAGALREVSLPLFVAAVVLNIVGTIIIPSIVTKLANQGGRIDLSLRGLVGLNLVLRFYVLVLPRAASMAMRWWRYSQAGRGDDALALMIFERVVQLLIMFGAAAVLLGLERSNLGPQAGYLWAVVLLVLFAVSVSFSLFFWPAASDVATKLLHLFDSVTPAFVRSKTEKLVLAIQAFHAMGRRSVISIIGLSAAAFVFFVLSPYVIASDMGLDISILAIAWIRALVFLLTLFPITIGGIGVREVSFVALLQLYGVPEGEAFAFSLTLLAIQLTIGAIGAILELWRHWLAPRLSGTAATLAVASSGSATEAPPSAGSIHR